MRILLLHSIFIRMFHKQNMFKTERIYLEIVVKIIRQIKKLIVIVNNVSKERYPAILEIIHFCFYSSPAKLR